MLLRGMKGSQAPGVCAELLNSPSTKCIAGSNEDAKAILSPARRGGSASALLSDLGLHRGGEQEEPQN